jgi:hypothetical protein
MHAVVRSYSGPGARELFDLLEARKDDVESVIRSVGDSNRIRSSGPTMAASR